MKKVALIIFSSLAVIIAIAFVYFQASFPKAGEPETISVKVTPEMMERGKYLVENVAICTDCHSQRDWSKFSGPVVKASEGSGGALFDENAGVPGKVYASNITPSSIGEWTDGELARAIVQGVSKDGRALFPLMPYLSYNKLTREDLYSIIGYIRSLKPIDNDVPKSELNFPVNILVNTLPLESYNPSPKNKMSGLEYGKYLTEIADCAGCHTPNKGGGKDFERAYAGGMEVNLPWGVVRSANITPDTETGIGSWSKETFIARFKSFASDSSGYRSVKNDEFNTFMPWAMYAGMSEKDLGLIFDYLRTVTPVKNRVVTFTPPANDIMN